MWKKYRSAGYPIISTWIDEGEEAGNISGTFTDLWDRMQKEVQTSNGLIFYGDVSDSPWKGAFIEVGMALAYNKPVAAIIIGEVFGPTHRPIGSWIDHRNVKKFDFVEQGFDWIKQWNINS